MQFETLRSRGQAPTPSSRRISSCSSGSNSSFSSMSSIEEHGIPPRPASRNQYNVTNNNVNTICDCEHQRLRPQSCLPRIINNRFQSENVNMHGRPLPTPPMVSPRRYFNGSPDLHAQTKHPYNTLPSRLAQRPASPSVQVSQQIDHDDILSRVPWFQPNLSREEVLDHLSKEEIGSFIIRESSTQQGCFALSVKVPKFENPAGLSHYLIYRTETNTNFRIKGLDKEWPNLSALVTHHTIMPELLPCTLKIPLPVRTRRQGSTASRSSDSSSSSSSNHSDKSFGVNKNSDSTDKPATLTKNISLQPTRQIGLV